VLPHLFFGPFLFFGKGSVPLVSCCLFPSVRRRGRFWAVFSFVARRNPVPRCPSFRFFFSGRSYLVMYSSPFFPTSGLFQETPLLPYLIEKVSFSLPPISGRALPRVFQDAPPPTSSFPCGPDHECRPPVPTTVFSLCPFPVAFYPARGRRLCQGDV